ncbi:MAG: hypothetical protein H6679_00095 [Epsilonproteobacteria bacterium]|nr:hypothetical protein [Campylobacterota bacterium]
MENNNNKNNKNDNKPSSMFTMPNTSMLQGLLAFIFGVILIVMSYKIILNMLFFIAGSMFVYYGLVLLKIDNATHFIDSCMQKLRSFINR